MTKTAFSEFDNDVIDPSDECTKEPKSYKGNDFVTDALRHSKVKLTWDQDDPNRIKMTRRALTREEIDEEDFKGLVAGSSEDESEPEPAAEEGQKKTKKEKMKERKEKLRALLLADDENGDIWGKAGASWQNELADIREDAGGKERQEKEDVEITFKPGLTLKTDDDELTTLDKYRLRMKEKKQKKKEARELRMAEKEEGDKADDFFGDSSDSEAEDVKSSTKTKVKSKSEPKSEPKPKTDATVDADELNLVQDPTHHFDLKDALMVAKDEKSKRKRKRKGKAAKEPELGPEGFSVDVADPRFKAMYDEAAFAVDPTHPKYVMSLVFLTTGSRMCLPIARFSSVQEKVMLPSAVVGRSTHRRRRTWVTLSQASSGRWRVVRGSGRESRRMLIHTACIITMKLWGALEDVDILVRCTFLLRSSAGWSARWRPREKVVNVGC